MRFGFQQKFGDVEFKLGTQTCAVVLPGMRRGPLPDLDNRVEQKEVILADVPEREIAEQQAPNQRSLLRIPGNQSTEVRPALFGVRHHNPRGSLMERARSGLLGKYVTV